VGYPLIDPVGPVIEHSQKLSDVFRQRDFLWSSLMWRAGAPGRTQQPRPQRAFPDGWTELVPELKAQDGDLLVTKHSWGAFANTDLDAKLKERGRNAGRHHGHCNCDRVEATARQAYELGYNVTLVTDAMTDMRAEAQQYSVTNVFPRLGETGSTQEVLDLLANR